MTRLQPLLTLGKVLSMKNVWSIWKKEIRSYFYTPIAYVFVGVFIFLMGFMFYAFLQTYLNYTSQAHWGGAPSITIDRLSEAFYGNMHLILMFFLPFFTMRLFTEEIRNNTFVLLLTSPISNWELVLSKFLAAVSVLFFMLSLTIVFPSLLAAFADGGWQNGPDLGIVFTTYLALFLVGSVYVSVGVFWSSVTKSQLIALVATFASCFFLWLLSLPAQSSEGWMGDFLRHLSIPEQFQSFLKGTIEMKAVVFLLSVVFFMLFLTHRSIEGRSWRS